MLSATFLTLSLATAALAGHHNVQQHAKRHKFISRSNTQFNGTEGGGISPRDGSNAPFTFYEAGLGACGSWNSDNDHIVALNSEDFGSGYPGPHCHATIVIEVDGVSVGATIMDECPGCHVHGPHGLDLTPGLFSLLGSQSVGVLHGSWWFDGGYDAAGKGPSGGGGGGSNSGQKTTSTTTAHKTTHTTSSVWTPPPPPPTSTKTTHSSTKTTTTSSKTSTSTTKAKTTTTTTTTSSSSSSTTTSETPTPSVSPPTSSDGETIEMLYEAFARFNNMIQLSLGDDQ